MTIICKLIGQKSMDCNAPHLIMQCVHWELALLHLNPKVINSELNKERKEKHSYLICILMHIRYERSMKRLQSNALSPNLLKRRGFIKFIKKLVKEYINPIIMNMVSISILSICK